MTKLTDLTTTQLRQIIALKEQMETLQSEIDSIAGGEVPTPADEEFPKKRRRSAAVRARMAAAQQARWAKIKGTGATDFKPAKRGKRRISAAGRAAMSAAGKARWAKVKGTPATPKPGQEGLAQQSGGQGQTLSGGQTEMGEGQGGGEEDAVRFGTAADVDG